MQGNHQELVRANHPPGTTPVIPAEFQYFPPMDGDVQEAGAKFPVKRLLGFLLKFWWIPLITLVLGLGTAAVLVWLKPPTYVSRARLVENIKLRLPEGSLFSEDVQNFVGTQTELLKSTKLREMTLDRLRSNTNTAAIPRGDDGEPLPIDIRVQSSKSSVFLLEASSSHPAYLQSYLDALMDVYLEYKKNIRKVVSGDTLASITEQVQKAERDLKLEQDILTAFQRTNNLAIIEEEGRISGGYLARLKTQLSDLELELRLLNSAAAANAADSSTNKSNLDIASLTGGLDASRDAKGDRPTTFQDLELLKMQRTRLSKNLRPKHPKIVKLDADIERANKLVEIYQRQNVEQLASSLSTVQLKIDNVQTSIREWESKVVIANSRIAEAERLKINVQRAQSVYERLAMLVQNVAISRNIDQETLSILEQASAPKRTYTQEVSIVTMAGFSGLGAGLGIILLITWRDDRFNSISEISDKLTTNVVGQLPDVNSLGNGAVVQPLLQMDDHRHAYAEGIGESGFALELEQLVEDAFAQVAIQEHDS